MDMLASEPQPTDKADKTENKADTKTEAKTSSKNPKIAAGTSNIINGNMDSHRHQGVLLSVVSWG